MAQATNTTQGEIVLSGDLAGSVDGTFLELRASGVTPGTYASSSTVTVDAKGRLLSVGAQSYSSTISVLPIASSSVKGIFSLAGFNVSSDGAATLNTPSYSPSSSAKGFATAGNGFTLTGSTITANTASGSVSGLVTAGSGFSIGAGVISVVTTSSGVKGVFSIDTASGLIVTNGSVALPTNIARTSVANVFQKAQNGALTSSSVTGTFTPDFQNGAAATNLTLTGNLTINFPTNLAPTGTLVEMQVIINNPSGSGYTVSLSGSYATNRTITFSDPSSGSKIDVLTLICTSSTCFAILNTTFS